MTVLKLTYFDFHGGRAEPVRLAFHLGGVAFEDHRFAFPQFAEVRKQTPFGQVPVLSVDGKTISQSDAILRYAGKLAGLYPDDTVQALLCDEVNFVVEEHAIKMDPTYRLSGEEQKTARLALVNSSIPVLLHWLAQRLQEQGGQFFGGDKLNIADLKVFIYTSGLSSGRLDHIPTSIVSELAPTLAAHAERIAALPEVQAYYAKFKA